MVGDMLGLLAPGRKKNLFFLVSFYLTSVQELKVQMDIPS